MEWWMKKIKLFFGFGENVFKFSLIKTSEGNLDPLKSPLKKTSNDLSFKINSDPHFTSRFCVHVIWFVQHFLISICMLCHMLCTSEQTLTLRPVHPQACWHICALDGTVHLAVSNLPNSESSAQTPFLISYWHCASHVRCRPVRRTVFPLWELVQSVPHKIRVL